MLVIEKENKHNVALHTFDAFYISSRSIVFFSVEFGKMTS